MTVLYLLDSTTVSGAEIVTLGYIDALRAQGHTAVAYISEHNHRLADVLRTRKVPVLATRHFSRELIRTTARPGALREFTRSFTSVRRELRDFIRRHDVQIVHSISYPASLYAALSISGTGVSHVWHEHNIKRIHRFNRPIYRFVGRSCTHVIGPSDAVTKNLARAVPDGVVRTVYNGIDLQRFAPASGERIEEIRRSLGIREGSRAVGLFGQMLPYKGHMTLVDAAPRILATCPDVEFLLVGALENPPYQDQLKARIAERGLAECVRFTGWQPNVHETMRAMDAIVVGTTTPEPASLALMEAMAVGTPLVATRTGGTPEIVSDEKTGLLYEPGQADQLADRVIRVLTDSTLSSALAAAGRARVEARFSLPRHIAAILGLYRGLDPLVALGQQGGSPRPEAARR
ncbi:MAG: glycosyltransferase family 4 protein [Vicinamibacterales bacterium]